MLGGGDRPAIRLFCPAGGKTAAGQRPRLPPDRKRGAAFVRKRRRGGRPGRRQPRRRAARRSERNRRGSGRSRRSGRRPPLRQLRRPAQRTPSGAAAGALQRLRRRLPRRRGSARAAAAEPRRRGGPLPRPGRQGADRRRAARARHRALLECADRGPLRHLFPSRGPEGHEDLDPLHARRAAAAPGPGSLGGRRFELRIRPGPGCSDGMSDRRYPLAAELPSPASSARAAPSRL